MQVAPTSQAHARILALALITAPLVFVGISALGDSGQTAQLSAEVRAAFFEAKVRPILRLRCAPCHGSDNPAGGLSLASRAAALKGGTSGPALVPGKASASLLVRAIRYDGRKMPPQGKLPATEIDALTRW